MRDRTCSDPRAATFLLMRKHVAIAMALSTTVAACRTSFDFVPATPADVRAGIATAIKDGRATLRDAGAWSRGMTRRTPYSPPVALVW